MVYIISHATQSDVLHNTHHNFVRSQLTNWAKSDNIYYKFNSDDINIRSMRIDLRGW